jgi:molecular chaperone GrpE
MSEPNESKKLDRSPEIGGEDEELSSQVRPVEPAELPAQRPEDVASETPVDPPADAPAEPVDPLARAQADASKMKDAWMRTAADFDNFRKRSRREVEDARKSGREDLLRTVLPVFDNLERAIQSSQRAVDIKAVSDGLAMVLKQFVDALGRAGIQKIETVGRSFDPQVHEAIQQVESKEHEPGTVLAEVQPGYTQGERLIRAAMVVVAKAPTDGSDREPGEPKS